MSAGNQTCTEPVEVVVVVEGTGARLGRIYLTQRLFPLTGVHKATRHRRVVPYGCT